LPDLVGQRSAHGRHDLHIVLGHFHGILGVRIPGLSQASLDSSDAGIAVKRPAATEDEEFWRPEFRVAKTPQKAPNSTFSGRRISFLPLAVLRGKPVQAMRANGRWISVFANSSRRCHV
jgi:hypothetical protein